MATRWGSTQRRRWTALSVDETPGSFRRLAEDETVREEWPAATLPPSALNGKSAAGRAGHEQGTTRRAGHVQGTAIREEQEQGIMPKEEPGKVGAIQEGQRKVTVTQKGDRQDAAIQQGQGQGAVTRQALSASLPRTKRADKKPSLFKAFTWSKGKKSRPKLVEAEGPENVASPHPGDHGADPQVTHTQPDQELPCHDYSERAVDVPGDDSSSKTRSPRSSSSSSSDSESPNTVNQTARDPRSATTTKTAERKHPAIAGTSETETRDLKVSEGQQSMQVDANASQRAPNSTASPGSTPGPQPSNQNLKKRGQGNCTNTDRNDPEQTSSPRPNPDIQSGFSDISGRSDTERVSASRDADEECSAREISSGESRFDTGRRFRLEATVLVDDERPAERRVTYLGPVLLSPVGQSQGQYVHVTVAPGSSGQASDGTSLMVRPAQPLPVGANSGPAAKAVHAGQDEGPITAVSPTSQGQGVDSKQNLPSATRQSNMDRPVSPTREQDGSSTSNEPEAKIQARVKTMTQDVQASLGADPSDRFIQVPSSSAGEEDNDNQAREKCREDGLDSRDASHLDSGKESMIGMREGAQTVFEPAASPILVDQSVCGSAPFSQAMFPEPDSMVCPVDVSVASVSESAPPPCAPPRNHRRLHSTSSSASSASTSSVSSSHNRSKQKSYDLVEAGENLSEKSGVQYPSDQMEEEVMTPRDSLHATKELPCEGQTITEECRTGNQKENNGDHHIERLSSSARHNIELLDPHVLLASEGRKPRVGSGNASPAAEDRCDLKTFTSPGVYVPDNTCLPQPVTVVIQDVQNCKQAPMEPAVINCIDQTYGNDPQVVSTTTTTIFRESESNASEQKNDTSSLDMSEGENLVGSFKEGVLMRPAEGRPLKPARTSLVKEDAVMVSEAPLDTAIDRPLLPLKGTPRQSSSSSSSDSEDGASKNKSAVDANGSRSCLEVHSTAHGFIPRLLDSVKTDSETLDCSGIERCDPRMSTKGYKEKQTDSSSANSSQFFTDTSLMTEEYKEKQTDSSSANSTQFFTDTSLMDHSDLPDSNELEIPVTSEEVSNAAWCFNEPHDVVVQRVDQQQLHNSSTSSLSHGKEFSDSEKSTSSSSASEKRDARKPPVFVTPPPPPEKPVRSCGSQSDLSERSELEQDTMRTPPKPARSMDRLSPSISPGFDRDKKKGDPSASKSLGPSSSETDLETEPPLVPPRREKPIKNGANCRPLSGDPFGHTSFTDSAINKADQDNSSSATSSLSEPKGDQWKPPSKQTQPFKKDPDHSQASAFIPYEDSEIYYTDTALLQKSKGEQSLTTRTVSNDSNQSKKGKVLECRRSDKSGSSSDESNKGKEDYSPPPIPPRQKMSGKKATTKSASDVNTSTSSVTSQGSIGSRDRSFSGGLEKPCVRPATECASGGSNLVPKHREDAPPFGLGTVASSTDRSSLSPSLQVDVLPETYDRRDTSFEVELSMQKEIPNTDVLNPQIFQSEVKLPLKPVRSPSPKVAVPRTPSPKLSTPQTLSPEVVPRSAGSTFSAAGARGKVKAESMQHTDEDTSEPDLKSSMNRSVSMSSTTSTTSHEEDKAKKGSRSKLRKYWPFRRKKGNKKEKKRKGQDTDNERSVSSPHLASAPLHHSTPTLERYASEPNTSGAAVPNNADMHDGNKHEDSDTSTLFESATEHAKEEKAKSESSDDKKTNLSTSTSSSEQGSNRKVKEKGSNKNKTAGHHKENNRSSGNQSSSSSRNVTPTPERKHKGGEKTDRKEDGQQNRDKSSPADRKRDQPASLSLSARGGRDAKHVKDKEDPEAQTFADLPLTPPRVATPLREHASPFYSVPHSPPHLDDHQPRFDGEFQRLDEDLQADADVATAVAERRPPMVVVAVDLGTTHSGYAFSFSRDPSSVYVMSRWAGQEPGLLNHKTLSALLLTPEARFHSFGLAARNHYHNLLPIEARHWLYFERFKMTLHHSKELSRNTLVTAINGKQLPALTVFAHVLEFFATHALQQLSDQSGTEFRRQDVRWVVTVPAIWREPAKQLMRQAALAAGMFSRTDPSQLLIVLEPEAASIYCRRLRMHQLVPEVGVARPLQSPRRSMELLSSSPAVSNLTVDGSKSCESLDSLSEPTLESKVKGTRYLVVDCGGGTVDITVHELTSTGQLVELHRATGGPHGSTGVDAEFEALLRSIFSSDFIDNYQTQFPVGWVNLMTDFESRKRAASPFKTTSFNVSLPFTFISEYRKHKGEVDQAVKKHGDPEVEWSLQGMLRLAPDAMRRLFASTLVSIRQAVGDVLNHPNTRELRYLFLVGGFAESPLLQHEIRREFGQLLTVLIPQDVSLAVLRGAVLFGLDPKVVSVRCARLTYGVGILNRFDPERHPVQKRVHRDGVDWCTDVFDRFVAINQPVALGTSVTRRYTPARSGQLLIVLNVYSSLHPAPTFITDPGVRKCGTLYLDLHASTSTHTDADGPDLKGADGEEGRDWEESQGGPREILARMAFGDTEISVIALDVRSGKEVKASMDFLSG